MTKQIFSDLQKIVDCEEYYINNVEMVKEGGNLILRVSINSNISDVDIDMCVKVTHIVNQYLDETDPIDYEYFLEVSSVGIDDTIHNFDEAIGKLVIVKTYAKVSNKKVLIGKLLMYDDAEYIVLSDGKEIKIPKEVVSQIRYHVEY